MKTTSTKRCAYSETSATQSTPACSAQRSVGINPDNPLENSTCFPLCKRGIEGDFCIRATSESPSPPFSKGGNTPPRPNSRLMDNLGLTHPSLYQWKFCSQAKPLLKKAFCGSQHVGSVRPYSPASAGITLSVNFIGLIPIVFFRSGCNTLTFFFVARLHHTFTEL